MKKIFLSLLTVAMLSNVTMTKVYAEEAIQTENGTGNVTQVETQNSIQNNDYVDPNTQQPTQDGTGEQVQEDVQPQENVTPSESEVQNNEQASTNDLESETEENKDVQPDIFGGYGVAIDVKTGDIYYNKHAEEAAYPASMTKLLTAIIIDEEMTDDEKIKVTPEAVGTECSCYGVEKDEKLTKKDAIEALMIKSANDVAVAAAIHIGGSVEDFAKIMNKRAKEIGVSGNTHFVTPNGLTDVNHHVTPYDMALITREAIKHPNVLKAMKSKKYTVHSNKKDVELARHDSIHNLPHAVGGKTGYTMAAGNTLAVYYKKGNKEVITVVMHSDAANHYSDSEIMSTYAFEHMKSKKIYEKNEKIDKVKFGTETVNLLAKKDFYVSYNKDEDTESNKKYKTKVKLSVEQGSIKKGQEVATAKIYQGGKVVGELTLVSDKTVKIEKKQLEKAKKVEVNQLSIWWALVIPWVIYALYLFGYNAQKRKRTKLKN